MAEKVQYAVGFDAGSARTRCVIALFENGRPRYLGHGEAESQGWVKGRVGDQNAVTESALAALREAESAAQVSVEAAVVGVGGPEVRGANTRGVLDWGRPREIDQRDVNRVMERSTHVQLQPDRMVLQMFPQDFVVEGHPGHRDPRKMVATQLEANVHLITASVQEHTCLVTAINQAHLSVEETIFEPLAACYAAVLPDDRREGIVLIDIGAHSTDVVAYYGDALQLAVSLPVSGDHFTRDLARGLCVTFEDAALLKYQHGTAVAESTGGNSFIELPATGQRAARETPRRVASQILEARAVELFRFVEKELHRVGMLHALGGGAVLTGGGALLPGMCDIAERVLNCQARNGLASGFRGWPEAIDNPAWTCAAGLAMYSAKLKAQGGQARPSYGLLGRLLR